MSTAGRTVLFSATTVALSMAAMLLFPMYFLKSFAYAGVATVAFAAAAAVVVTPAAIWLLGDRLDAPRRAPAVPPATRRPEPAPKPVEQIFWYRSTKVGHAPRRSRSAWPSSSCCWRSARRSSASSGASPTTGCCRRRRRRIRSATNCATTSPTTRRPRSPSSSPTPTGLPRTRSRRYAADLSEVADVSSVSAPTGTFVGGATGRTAVRRRPGVADGSAFLTVGSTAPLFSDASEAQLDRAARASRARTVAPVQLDRHRADQPRQRRGDHRPAAAGARADRGHHVRAAVPADRQRRAAAESRCAERACR